MLYPVHIHFSSDLLRPALTHAGLSCSFSGATHLCCCQNLHFCADEGPVVFTITGKVDEGRIPFLLTVSWWSR